MPRGMNKAQIIGFVGQDPEMKTTPGGNAVCSFSVATTEATSANGAKKEYTTWHRITAWGKLAEIVGKYVHKGQQVYVEGRIQHREWEDKQGAKRTATEIVAREVLLLGKKGSDEGGNDIGEENPPF